MVRRTIKKTVEVSGLSLHSGSRNSIRLEPAEPGTGRRLNGEIVGPHMLAHAAYATTLKTPTGGVSTVEHLFAALQGLRVDDICIWINGGEIPILDGSARGWVDQLTVEEQPGTPDIPVEVSETFEIKVGDSWVLAEPAPHLSITVQVDFLSLGASTFEATAEQWEDVADARTFGFLADADRMRAQGLARGASLDNTLVFDQGQPLNVGGLRYHDEVARHKWLDFFGDLYALGRPVIGSFKSYRNGHKLHHKLVKALSELATCPGFGTS